MKCTRDPENCAETVYESGSRTIVSDSGNAAGARRGSGDAGEEMRKKLWPNNTIVEFDHSINAAIKRLREALNDFPDDPRFVETLARRGYRSRL